MLRKWWSHTSLQFEARIRRCCLKGSPPFSVTIVATQHADGSHPKAKALQHLKSLTLSKYTTLILHWMFGPHRQLYILTAFIWLQGLRQKNNCIFSGMQNRQGQLTKTNTVNRSTFKTKHCDFLLLQGSDRINVANLLFAKWITYFKRYNFTFFKN